MTQRPMLPKRLGSKSGLADICSTRRPGGGQDALTSALITKLFAKIEALQTEIVSLRDAVSAPTLSDRPIARVKDHPDIAAKREARRKLREEIVAAKAARAEIEARLILPQPGKDERDAEYWEQRKLIRKEQNKAAQKTALSKKEGGGETATRRANVG
jgi:hypothetical protein